MLVKVLYIVQCFEIVSNDRIAATNILNDRAFGKSPRHIYHHIESDLEPAPEADANDVGAIRESICSN